MKKYRFLQVDVFTDVAFGGNPLAVFYDAEGLSSGDMQKIALEMNLSETTFVLPPETPGADFKVRIFTPKAEIPFAGHPLVGTHWALAHLGMVKLREPVTEVKFELAVGVRAADLHVEGGRVSRIITGHQRPVFGAVADEGQVARLAKALGLAVEAVTGTGWPVQVVSSGIPQLFVPVRSLQEVRSLDVTKQDAGEMYRICRELDVHADLVMAFCLETEREGSDVHSRFFAHSMGIPEDPVTGSASGGLGGYLVGNRVIPATPPVTRITSEQGIEMGRPGRVEILVEGSADDISMIRVGGGVVPVVEGELSF